MNGIYIALGSNIGDREGNLKRALDMLEESSVHIIKKSKFYETKPYGVADQPDFLNAVAEVSADMQPIDLLHTMQDIERRMGRERKRHWGERNIDLDLLIYPNVIMDTPELTLPHKDMENREFVLRPMTEIAPDLVHPVLGSTMQELLNALLYKKMYQSRIGCDSL